MSRLLRSSLTVLLIVLSASFLAQAIGGGQAPASAATAAEAAPFIGEWLVTVAMESFQNAFVVSIKTDGGKVAATVSSQAQPTVKVTYISVSA